jgi:hypothetical protein
LSEEKKIMLFLRKAFMANAIYVELGYNGPLKKLALKRAKINERYR